MLALVKRNQEKEDSEGTPGPTLLETYPKAKYVFHFRFPASREPATVDDHGGSVWSAVVADRLS